MIRWTACALLVICFGWFGEYGDTSGQTASNSENADRTDISIAGSSGSVDAQIREMLIDLLCL